MTRSKPKPPARAVDRIRQEKALDDALMNTFPASDPVSITQPKPPAAPPEGEAKRDDN